MYRSIGALWLLVATPALASTDPIATDPSTGAHFNRYAYANNNPYKFADPDGRAGRIVHEQGRIRVEVPTQFIGVAATPENIAVVTTGFESQSGVYKVNGQPMQVDFRVTELTEQTPRRLRNVVTMFDGPTDHPKGTGENYANAIGGTKVSLNVQSVGFAYNVGGHEMNHLIGADDAYLRDKDGKKYPNPLRRGDIMNELPGRMTDTVVGEILREPNNHHVGE